MRAVGLIFVLFTSSLTLADDAQTPEPKVNVKPAHIPLRVVRILPNTHQALLFDKSRHTHVLAEVGATIAGFHVDEVADDEVILSANGTQFVLAAPDTEARHRDDEPLTSGATRPVDPYAKELATTIAEPVDPYADPAARTVPQASDTAARADARTHNTSDESGAQPTDSPTPVTPEPVVPTTPTSVPASAAPAPSAVPASSAPAAAGRPTPTVTAPTAPAPVASPAPAPAPTSAPEPAVPTIESSTNLGHTASPDAGRSSTESSTNVGQTAPPEAVRRSIDTTLSRDDVRIALADFAKLTAAVHGAFTPAGARIDGLAPGSLFAKVGLRTGDVVTAINGQPILSVDDAADLYVHATTTRNLAIQVTRNGKPVTLKVTIQ
jgi:hypothetical protein